MTDHALTSDPPVHRPTAPDFTQIANRSEVIAVLENQAGAVRGELARVDGKAGLLLSWAGGAFAIVAAATVTGTTRLPAPATAGLWAALAVTLPLGALA
jgi:transposase